jgi:hypothetical protein
MWPIADYQDVKMVERVLGPYTCPIAAAVFVMFSGIVWIVAYRTREKQKLARSREARGLCVACGYDLRGNTSQRCPECGRTKLTQK